MILGCSIACSLIHERVFPEKNEIKDGHKTYHQVTHLASERFPSRIVKNREDFSVSSTKWDLHTKSRIPKPPDYTFKEINA